MRLQPTLLALLLGTFAGTASASDDSARNGLLPIPANRIVGLWHVAVSVGPCAGGPVNSFFALNTFHAGGTNTFAPGSRGPGMGVWSHQGRGKYQTRFQFPRYLSNGSYDGLQDVRATLELDRSGRHYTNTIYARVLNPDESLRVELCGSAVGERVEVR
jgi:hypothetical protein